MNYSTQSLFYWGQTIPLGAYQFYFIRFHAINPIFTLRKNDILFPCFLVKMVLNSKLLPSDIIPIRILKSYYKVLQLTSSSSTPQKLNNARMNPNQTENSHFVDKLHNVILVVDI